MVGVLWAVAILASVASADEVDLDAGDGPMGSALDGTTVDAAAGEGESAWVPLVIVRGQNFVRPVSGLVFRLDPDAVDGAPRASRLGLEAGRRWYPLGEPKWPWLVEVFGGLSAPFLGARGVRLSGGGQLGMRWGPLGVGIGPHVRWDRATFSKDDSVLASTSVVGPRGDLSLTLGPFIPSVGVAPGWQLGGDRVPATDGVLPILGDETLWSAGLGIQVDEQLWLPSLSWRETGNGPEVEFLLAVRLSPKLGRRSP